VRAVDLASVPLLGGMTRTARRQRAGRRSRVLFDVVRGIVEQWRSRQIHPRPLAADVLNNRVAASRPSNRRLLRALIAKVADRERMDPFDAPASRR
jgi:hypothetical protein